MSNLLTSTVIKNKGLYKIFFTLCAIIRAWIRSQKSCFLLRFDIILRGHVLVWVDNTAVVAYINRQDGLHSCGLNKLAQQFLFSVPVPQGDLHSRKHECYSRSTVLAWGHTQGLEAPSRYGQSDLGKILRSRGGSLRFSGNSAMSPLLPTESSCPMSLDSMAHAWTKKCLYAFPLIALLLGVLAKVHQQGSWHLLIALADQSTWKCA